MSNDWRRLKKPSNGKSSTRRWSAKKRRPRLIEPAWRRNIEYDRSVRHEQCKKDTLQKSIVWNERQEEAQCRESRHETSLTPGVSPDPELPWNKGKEPELAPELEVGQESQRCDSCLKQNAECVCIKVSD